MDIFTKILKRLGDLNDFNIDFDTKKIPKFHSRSCKGNSGKTTRPSSVNSKKDRLARVYDQRKHQQPSFFSVVLDSSGDLLPLYLKSSKNS